MRSKSSRPIQHRVLAFLVLLLLALATLGGMILRNLHHVNTVLSHAGYSHSVQNISIELQQTLIEYLTEALPVAYPPEELAKTVAALDKTLAEMDSLLAADGFLSPHTRTIMAAIKTTLLDIGQLDAAEKNARLIAALKQMSHALDQEVLARDRLLETIGQDTETELYMASIMFVVILMVAGLFFRRRILHPLNDLQQLLQRLTEENYSPFRTDHLDPLIVPVFTSYNEMVKHLTELEEANRAHAQSLQKEVRIATQALLEQQHSLARAERLAAIGEVAAELAHEIRNPLAGVQVAFSNLRFEIDDAQQCERMAMIDSELKRLAKLLNDTLEKSRHLPEPSSQFDVAASIRDLMALTRYQIAEAVQLSIDAPASLKVNLPEGGFRQALLNLLLNAADAVEAASGFIGIQIFQDGQGIHVNVLDNGPGFSQDMLDYGIRPFRTSRQRGTGLGLAMVQRFVREAGGSIQLTNRQPAGACVSIVLPVACLAGNST